MITRLLALCTLLAALPAQAAVHLLEVDGAISPASADYIVRHLDSAAAADAELVVLRMDTPGGLDKSMRQIIKAILASPVPVATWVAPEGSRAASAGTYILYASHIAAMAPATNLGAATPVSIGGPTPGPLPGSAPAEDPPAAEDTPAQPETEPDTVSDEDPGGRAQPVAPDPGTAMERKVINDAVAYIRGLAELRGRNIEWAERAVRDAESLSAQEALERNVIDLVAADLDALLAGIDGRTVQLDGDVTVTLATAGLPVERIEPDWRTELLAVITDPNVAYILMMIGVYGLILEFYNPGTGPGIVGVICLLLAMYALQMLPVSWAGLALLTVGIAMMLVEGFSPGFGVFGAGGVVAFVIGSVILFDADMAGFGVHWGLIAAFAVASVVILGYLVTVMLQSRQARVTTGTEAMLGSEATALEDFTDGRGQVRAMGEIWTARAEVPVSAGDLLTISAVNGLVLHVAPTAAPTN